MNEKDTIIGLQQEVIDGLKKELKTVYYCGDKLSEKIVKLEKQCKRNSNLYYIMGIGTGIVICDLVYKFIASREEKLNDSANIEIIEDNQDENFND